MPYSKLMVLTRNPRRSKLPSRIWIQLALGTICLALSTAAHADVVTLTLDGNWPSAYAFYTYTDTSGNTQASIPVSPYQATVNGGGYDNMAALMFCYDYNSPTYVGVTYPGTVVPVSDFSGATQTAMMEATYLLNDLDLTGGLDAPLATRGAISFAIWELMNPSSTTSLAVFPTDPAAVPYEKAAINAVANGIWTAADAAHFPTWVPDDSSIQRFGGIVLASDPPVSKPLIQTPEPSSLIPLGFGILGLLVFGRFAGWRH